MKKEYLEPDAEWIRFSDTNIITASATEAPGGEFNPEDVSPWG